MYFFVCEACIYTYIYISYIIPLRRIFLLWYMVIMKELNKHGPSGKTNITNIALKKKRKITR